MKRFIAVAARSADNKLAFYRPNVITGETECVSPAEAVHYGSSDDAIDIIKSYKRDLPLTNPIDYIVYQVKSNVTNWLYEFYDALGVLKGTYPIH